MYTKVGLNKMHNGSFEGVKVVNYPSFIALQ